MASTEFKIRPDGFAEIRKAMLMRGIPLTLVALTGGLAISYFSSPNQNNDATVWVMVIPIALLAGAFGLYRGVKRQQKLFDSYILSIGASAITREQYNTTTISIPFAEIKDIAKQANGGFTIKGNSKTEIIGIPPQIDEYGKLEQLLSGIKPITVISGQPVSQKMAPVISFLVLVLMAAVYISKNKIVVGLSGTALLLVMGYSFFEIQRNKNIDRRTKMSTWLLITVFASVIGIMYFKLSGRL